MLLLHDRVDEWVVSHMTSFDGKSLQSVAKGDLDLGGLAEDDAEAKRQQDAENDFKPMLERVRTALGTKAKEVRLTHRLTESPRLPGERAGRHERETSSGC